MQFQIPQFIEIENKIVGPLTLKQFFFLAVGFGFSFIFFFLFDFWLWFLLTLIIGTIAVGLAFFKINGIPLPMMILHALIFFWRPRLYLWQRSVEEKVVKIPDIALAPVGEKETKEKIFSDWRIPSEVKRKSLKEYFGGAPSVKKLWHDLMTTKEPIPKREKVLIGPWQPKEYFQVFRKMTGEKEVVRRVDYR